MLSKVVPEFLLYRINPSKEILQYTQQTNVFSFCNYPFLLDVGAKQQMMTEESYQYMHQAVSYSAIQEEDWILRLRVHRYEWKVLSYLA